MTEVLFNIFDSELSRARKDAIARSLGDTATGAMILSASIRQETEENIQALQRAVDSSEQLLEMLKDGLPHPYKLQIFAASEHYIKRQHPTKVYKVGSDESTEVSYQGSIRVGNGHNYVFFGDKLIEQDDQLLLLDTNTGYALGIDDEYFKGVSMDPDEIDLYEYESIVPEEIVRRKASVVSLEDPEAHMRKHGLLDLYDVLPNVKDGKDVRHSFTSW